MTEREKPTETQDDSQPPIWVEPHPETQKQITNALLIGEIGMDTLLLDEPWDIQKQRRTILDDALALLPRIIRGKESITAVGMKAVYVQTITQSFLTFYTYKRVSPNSYSQAISQVLQRANQAFDEVGISRIPPRTRQNLPVV